MDRDVEANASPVLTTSSPFGRKAQRPWIFSLLLILPLVMVVASAQLREVRGPYWLAWNTDPDYAYLLNSLRIAHGLAPIHRDHPGTTLQMFGAAVLLGMHLSVDTNELTSRVINDPEAHLDSIRRSLTWLYAFVLLVAGGVVYRQTGSLLLAFCMQSAPLLSATALAETARVRPEPVLLILSELLALTVFLHITRPGPRRLWLTAGAFGIVVGLALATKLTAAPLALIPLVLLPTGRSRLYFLAAAVIAFLAGIAPMLAYLQEFLGWVRALLTHEGYYGNGAEGFLDPSRFLREWKDFVLREPGFVLILLSSLWILVKGLARGTLSNGSEPPRLERALLAIAVAQVSQWILTAKMPRFHYLVPSEGLLGLSLVLLVSIALRDGWVRTPRSFVALLAAVIAVSVLHTRAVVELRRELSDETTRQLGVHELVRHRYKTWTQVNGYGSSSVLHALYFGDSFCGEYLYPWIRRAYPDPKFIYFNIWNQTFRSSRGLIPRERLMRKQRKMVIRGGVWIRDILTDWNLTPIVLGKYENLYEWKAEP